MGTHKAAGQADRVGRKGARKRIWGGMGMAGTLQVAGTLIEESKNNVPVCREEHRKGTKNHNHMCAGTGIETNPMCVCAGPVILIPSNSTNNNTGEGREGKAQGRW